MEITSDQRERIKESMDKYKLFLDHGVPMWGVSDITIVNEVRKQLGLDVHTHFSCGRCIPDLVFKEVYRLYIQ